MITKKSRIEVFDALRGFAVMAILLVHNLEHFIFPVYPDPGVIFDMWQKFAFTFVLISSFVLLYKSERFKNTVSNLRFYGIMSLTNYITLNNGCWKAFGIG